MEEIVQISKSRFEELLLKEKRLEEFRENLKTTQILSPYYVQKHYISKDKIKAKIEELEKDLKNYKEEYTMWCYDLECLEDIRVKEARIEILKELLGE